MEKYEEKIERYKKWNALFGMNGAYDRCVIDSIKREFDQYLTDAKNKNILENYTKKRRVDPFDNENWEQF